MNRFLSNKWLVLSLRIAIGAIFVYAGVLKIGTPESFADSIATFQLLPDFAVNLVALGLPPFEILAGLMMITGIRHRSANLAILLLTVAFIVGLMQGLARGLEIDCGCFGSGKPSPLKTWLSLGRDLLLLAAALLTYRANFKKTRPSIEVIADSPNVAA